eukprot:TRINITY_DN14978_c0_g2_i1.p1 TRINITY_DN14978_c0_g2~~TRINITY_DN14978_c0_g2_i1.p1  ORF type:complete len:427 (+),score=65.65 TRINITY_DN14978_c0_g2_i1:100-1380(+)
MARRVLCRIPLPRDGLVGIDCHQVDVDLYGCGPWIYVKAAAARAPNGAPPPQLPQGHLVSIDGQPVAVEADVARAISAARSKGSPWLDLEVADVPETCWIATPAAGESCGLEISETRAEGVPGIWLLVDKVDPGGAGEAAGVRPGCYVTRVSGVPVSTGDELLDAFSAAQQRGDPDIEIETWLRPWEQEHDPALTDYVVAIQDQEAPVRVPASHLCGPGGAALQLVAGAPCELCNLSGADADLNGIRGQVVGPAPPAPHAQRTGSCGARSGPALAAEAARTLSSLVASPAPVPSRPPAVPDAEAGSGPAARAGPGARVAAAADNPALLSAPADPVPVHHASPPPPRGGGSPHRSHSAVERARSARRVHLGGCSVFQSQREDPASPPSPAVWGPPAAATAASPPRSGPFSVPVLFCSGPSGAGPQRR